MGLMSSRLPTFKSLHIISHNFSPSTRRAHELCMLEVLQQDDVTIQLVVKNAPWQSFLIFWDRLLENQKLVTAYNQLKQDSQYLTMDEYRFKKAKFIERVFNQP